MDDREGDNGMLEGRPSAARSDPFAAVDVADEGHARSARREATRQRILDAAREVFAERGVIGGTVEDICEAAGFTRGAFYSNFADKADVVRALLAREHGRMLAHLDATFDAPGLPFDGPAGGMDPSPSAGAGAAAVMAAQVERLLGSVPVDRRFFLIQSELELHAVRDPDIAREFREADARLRARVADFIRRGLDRAGRELAVTADEATDAVLGIAEHSIRRALIAGGDADPTALSRVMLPLVLAAVSRPRAAG
jgi:AcrR family transcriptional regulator